MSLLTALFHAYFPSITLHWQLAALALFLLTFALCRLGGRKDALRLRMGRALSISALSGYAFLLLAMLVLSRGIRAEYSYDLRLFHTYERLLAGGAVAAEWGALALFNGLLFVPFGFLLAAVRRGNSVGTVRVAALCGFSYSLLLETLQLVLRRGTCELDDLLHNTIGAVFGALCWLLLRRIICK